jgi:tRNA(Ile)-lysidine synthetase-like protein
MLLANLEDHLQFYLTQHNLLHVPLCFGYSGGVDSTALLIALSSLYIQKIITHCPKAVYVRHGLRPKDETEKEEYLLIKNCINRSIPLILLEGNEDQIRSIYSETDARFYRFKLFETFLQENRIPVMLTAHHLDDHREFQLLRISQGNGWKSFLGILDNRPLFRKPLLSITKSVLESYVKSHGIEVSIDSTNQSNKIERNVIRNTILPAWAVAKRTLYKSFELNQEKAQLLSQFISNQLSEFSWTYDFCQISTLLPTKPIHPYLLYELLLEGIGLLEDSNKIYLNSFQGIKSFEIYGESRKERKTRISLDFFKPIMFSHTDMKIQGHGLEISRVSNKLIVKSYLAYSSEYGYSFSIEPETSITTPDGIYLGNRQVKEPKLIPEQKSKKVLEFWLPINHVRCSSYNIGKKQEPNQKKMSIFTHNGTTLGYLIKDESGSVSFNSSKYSDSITTEKALVGFIPFTYGDEK